MKGGFEGLALSATLLVPVKGIERKCRLKIFWNSARTKKLYLPSLPRRKFRPKLIDSAGCRCQR